MPKTIDIALLTIKFGREKWHAPSYAIQWHGDAVDCNENCINWLAPIHPSSKSGNPQNIIQQPRSPSVTIQSTQCHFLIPSPRFVNPGASSGVRWNARVPEKSLFLCWFIHPFWPNVVHAYLTQYVEKSKERSQKTATPTYPTVRIDGRLLCVCFINDHVQFVVCHNYPWPLT